MHSQTAVLFLLSPHPTSANTFPISPNNSEKDATEKGEWLRPVYLWQPDCVFLTEFYLFFLSASLTEKSRSPLSIKSNPWVQCQHPTEADQAARVRSQAAALSWGWRQRGASAIYPMGPDLGAGLPALELLKPRSEICLDSKDREKEPPGVKYLLSYSPQSKKDLLKMFIGSNVSAWKPSKYLIVYRMKSKLPDEDQKALNGLAPHDQYGLNVYPWDLWELQKQHPFLSPKFWPIE